MKKLCSLALAALLILSSGFIDPNRISALDESAQTAALAAGTVYEAEAGGNTLNSVTVASGKVGSSGGFVADGFGDTGDSITFNNVTVSKTGEYAIRVRYCNGSQNQTYTVYANGASDNAAQLTFNKLWGWEYYGAGTWGYATVNLHLTAGQANSITVARVDSGSSINLDCIVVSTDPVTLTDTGAVTNSGFETGDLTGWTTSGTGTVGVDSGNVCIGSKKLYCWSSSAFESTVSQTVSGLEDGAYLVSAYVRVENEFTAEMRLSGYDGDATTAKTCAYNVSDGSNKRDIWAWQEQTVIVKDGTLTISFYANSAGNTTLSLDNVILWKINSADKSQLEAAIAAASSQTQGTASDTAWSAFAGAQTTAAAVMNNTAATQTEIDTAQSDLSTKMAALTGIQYTVTASAGENGTVSPAAQTVASGQTASFIIAPAEDYEIATVTVTPDTAYTLSENTLTLENVSENLSVIVSFAKTQTALDAEAANAVIAKIAAIGTVTLDSEAAIIEAETAYVALSDAQKLLVTNYGNLTVARTEYDRISAPADYTAVDTALSTVPADLTLYTDASSAALNQAITAVDRTKKVAEQSTVDAMAAAITKAVNSLIEKAVEMSISISEGMVTNAAESGKYNITWNATVNIGSETSVSNINQSDLKFISYGVYYATDEEELNALLSGTATDEAKQKVFDSGEDIDVYTMFGFRLKNVSANKSRTAMFYLKYEYNGKAYAIFSTADTTSTAISAD